MRSFLFKVVEIWHGKEHSRGELRGKGKGLRKGYKQQEGLLLSESELDISVQSLSTQQQNTTTHIISSTYNQTHNPNQKTQQQRTMFSKFFFTLTSIFLLFGLITSASPIDLIKRQTSTDQLTTIVTGLQDTIVSTSILFHPDSKDSFRRGSIRSDIHSSPINQTFIVLLQLFLHFDFFRH